MMAPLTYPGGLSLAPVAPLVPQIMRRFTAL